MNTAGILVAYTSVMIYAAARAKRKVAELVNSFGSAVGAKSIIAPITAAAANNMARNDRALPKNCGNEAVFPLTKPIT
jgi:hypothetical protein